MSSKKASDKVITYLQRAEASNLLKENSKLAKKEKIDYEKSVNTKKRSNSIDR